MYYIDLYGYDSLFKDSSSELKTKLKKTRVEFLLLQSDQSVALRMDPEDNKKKSILLRLIPCGNQKAEGLLPVRQTIADSGWTYSHDLGRLHLQHTFSDQVTTSYYENVTQDNIAEYLQKAIDEDNDIIFTTSRSSCGRV